MEDAKVESLLIALTREQKLRSDLEVQVSQMKQRVVCHKKYLTSLKEDEVRQILKM